jgi:chromosome segregation ATPase
MSRRFLAVLVLAPLVLAGWPAAADESSEVEQLREQLRSTVLQLRALQDQQAAAPAPAPAAAAPDAASKAKLAAVEGQLRAAKARAAGAQAQIDKLKGENDALTSAQTAQAAELDKYKQAYAQASDTGRDLATERDKLKTQLAIAANTAGACQAKNTRLIAFTEGVLEADRKVGFVQVLGSREPLFGLRRVQLENIAQEREDTLRANRCDPRLDAVAKPAPRGG